MIAKKMLRIACLVAPLGLALMLVGPLSAGKLSRSNYGGQPVSSVIFPDQEIPLRFSHKLHLSKGLDCDFCHEDASDSKSSLDNLIPTEEACDSCHPIERDKPNKMTKPGKPPARCVTCHPAYDVSAPSVRRVRIPPPNLKFSHKAHVSRGVTCKTCHGDLEAEGVALATRAQLPKMKLCLSCHNGTRASKQCATCHLSSGRELMTDFPAGKLRPSGSLRGADHDLLFRTSHKAAAQNDSAFCQQCHKKAFCVGCHNATIKPMDFHGNDYVSLHPIEARRNQPQCQTCHRVQTFCVGCHSRSGVAADRGGSEFLPASSQMGSLGRNFHPRGWVEFGGGGLSDRRGGDHHSFQAQRNIRQCASCHREEFCKGCHTAEEGSFRVNPHPGNWRGSRRCKALAKRAGRMCLRCHTDVGEANCSFMR